MDAAIYSLAGLVAVWFLRPVLVEALRARVPAVVDQDASRGADRPRRRPVDTLEDEAGPVARLTSRVLELEHAFKLLQNEWTDKESRVDSLLKRINRLRKLEGDTEPEPQPTVPQTREQVLAIFRAQQRGQ